jgi:hypothetical protein
MSPAEAAGCREIALLHTQARVHTQKKKEKKRIQNAALRREQGYDEASEQRSTGHQRQKINKGEKKLT